MTAVQSVASAMRDLIRARMATSYADARNRYGAHLVHVQCNMVTTASVAALIRRGRWCEVAGHGIGRSLADGGGYVTVRPAWDGGHRVTVYRDPDDTGVYVTTHSRRFA